MEKAMMISGRSRVQMPQFVRFTFHAVNRVAIGFTALVAVVKIVQAASPF